MSVLLVAVKPLTYHGRAVIVGEVFAVRPIEAAAFLHQRVARYAPPEAPEAAPVRRRYRRRDLTAESS